MSPRCGPPPLLCAQASVLSAAFPGYEFTITWGRSRYRIEAIRKGPGPGPWCVISTGPWEIYRVLARHTRPAWDIRTR